MATEPIPTPAILDDEQTRHFYDFLERTAAMPLGMTAPAAASAVLCTLASRLSGGEARHLMGSLPPALHALLMECQSGRKEPGEAFGRAEFLRRVANQLGISVIEAEVLARDVFAGVRRLVDPKVVHDVESQLPRDMRELWRSPPVGPLKPPRPYTTHMGPYSERVRHSDDEIRSDVEETLSLDSWVDEDAIEVNVTGGVVTLTGTVRSLLEKRSAGDDAFDTPGIADVRNELQITG
jgi:uncharacterized protein (DUF2267 family)